jgi:hypothetical protein
MLGSGVGFLDLGGGILAVLSCSYYACVYVLIKNVYSSAGGELCVYTTNK